MLAGALVGAWCLAPAGASAGPPDVIIMRLEYAPDPRLATCPPEAFFRNVVAGHLGGRDPFQPSGVKKVRVVIRRIPGGFAGKLFMLDAADQKLGSSTEASDGSCVELVETLAAVVVPWLLPIVVPDPAKPEPPPPPAPPPEPERPATAAPGAPCAPCEEPTRYDVGWFKRWPLPPLPAPEPDPPKPLDRYPVALRLGFVPRVEWVVSGSGSLGFSGEFGVRYHAVSLDFEMHGDPSIGTQSVASGSVGFSLLTGALLLCGSYEWFEGCGVAEVGRLSFAEPFRGMPPSAPYGAAGVRGAMNVPIAPPRLFLHATLDVLAPIHPASYASRNDVFQVAGTAAGIGIGLLAEISP